MIKIVKSIPFRSFACKGYEDLTCEIVEEEYKKARIDILTKLGCIAVSDKNQSWSEEFINDRYQKVIVVRYSDDNSQKDHFEMFRENYKHTN